MKAVLATVVVLSLIVVKAAAGGRTDAERAVCTTFKQYCGQALRVVSCETGGTWSTWARNGQYLGLFQMGSWERAHYGHGSDPWTQARAAWRYFADTGYSWSPWSCKP